MSTEDVEAARSGGTVSLSMLLELALLDHDPPSWVTITGPGCLVCEQGYENARGTACPGYS